MFELGWLSQKVVVQLSKAGLVGLANLHHLNSQVLIIYIYICVCVYLCTYMEYINYHKLITLKQKG